jgi:ketosteroid isomerase-like protein
MKRWALIAIGSLALTLATWALFFRGSEEDAIRATLKRTADAVKVIDGENPVMRAARVRGELIEVLLADVAVNIPELTDVTKGRDPLIGTAIGAAQLWSTADVSIAFGRVQIDGDSAFAEVTATLSATRHGGETERDVRKCSFRLLKRDGRFRISEVTVYPRESS